MRGARYLLVATGAALGLLPAAAAHAADPRERAAELVAQMTLDEKISQLHGIRTPEHRRFVPGIDRLGIPPLRITNGPAGMVPSDDFQQKPATALPAPISLAATFDRSLAQRHGELSGEETRDLAHNLLEAPDINIARVPVNGRTFEGYGEDPYLAGEIAAPNIRGIQSVEGIIAEVKHYAANNQEANRFEVDEVIDDRTLHEIYLPHFEASVKEGRAGAVMCAFPRINGTFSCEHEYLLNDVLRGQWGFDGFVQSDFGATHSTVESALAGMDLEMATAEFYGDEMKQAVEEGRIDVKVVDELIVRRLATMLRLGVFDRPPTPSPIPVEEHGRFARTAAEEGTVLLKNQDGALPLDEDGLDSIAVIGEYAATTKIGGGGSSLVVPTYAVNPVDGIEERVGEDVAVRHARGADVAGLRVVPASALRLKGEYFQNVDFAGEPALVRPDEEVHFTWPGGVASGLPGNRFSARWTGTLTAPTGGDHVLGLTSDDGSRLYVDGELVVDNWGDHSTRTVTATVPLDAGPHDVRVEYYDNTGSGTVTLGWLPPGATGTALEEAVEAARASDVAVVMVGDDQTEGRDKPNLSLPGEQDRLIEAVAAANPRTIVVVKSGGPVLMPWLDKVPAVVEAWYPGQEDGGAVASVLFGDADPAGRLPITFPKAEGDVPASTPEQYPGVDGTATYSEGLNVGYRHYDARGVEPLFPFGFGLSYTSFRLSDLTVSEPERDGDVEVGLEVANTGRRAGAAVPQVYLSFPEAAGEPPRQLKGFEKVWLRPGQRKRLTIELDRRAFSIWDSTGQRWTTVAGRYDVHAGQSSRDLPLRGAVTLEPGCGGAPWMDRRKSPDERAGLLIPEMTLDEKVSMLHSVSDSGHSRETLPIARLCIPALRLNNGSNGVGSGGPVQPQATALPAPLGLAATFDPKMAFRFGTVMGRETRNVGRNLQEGPDINIARVPLNGRTFEAYGEDPLLVGEMATAVVRGIQSEGTIGEPKHYVANNQEIDRDKVNELIDERTLRQIYLPGYEMPVKRARAGGIMCAKNKVNGAYSCEHEELLQGVLKDEWGFDGFVVSDFNSCHDTIRCAFGGLDFELPSGTWYGDRLKAAVQAGQVPTAVLDEHVHRVLRTMLRFGLFERPQTTTPIDAARGGRDSRAVAEAATVLLKNEGGVLPLDTRRDDSIALIGPGSHTAVASGGGSTGVSPLYTVTPLEAIRRRAGDRVEINASHGMGPVEIGPQPAVPAHTVAPEGAAPGERGWTARYFANTTWSGEPAVQRTEQWVDTNPSGGPPAPGLPHNGWSVRWTATFKAPVDGDYTFRLTNQARARLYLDDGLVLDNPGGFPGITGSATVHLTAGQEHAIRVDWAKSGGQAMVELSWIPPASTPNVEIQEAVEAAKRSDVAVVFAANKDTEAFDRPDLSLLGHQDELIQAVAEANPRTVVVLNAGSPVTMPWLDDVAGVLETWYPGSEAGNAAASVLFGDTDPSGRLPITFPKRLEDTPASTPEQYPGVDLVAQYSEGLRVGYRHYDARDVEPLFPFGFGLSYTTFRLDDLKVRGRKVSATVKNTGRRRGSQVVQVYVGGADGSGPDVPPRRLEGFAKVWLDPGERRRVEVDLGPRAFAHWDADRDAWVQPAGTYTVLAGTSSRDLPLSARVKRDAAVVP